MASGTPVSSILVGSTGLVGSHILQTLLSSPHISTVHAFARRSLPTSPTHADKLHPIITDDTTAWPTTLSTLHAPLFLSALGTTQAAAGSTTAQRAIDHDLNLSLAQAAQRAGTKVYVLISTAGASASSRFAYPKMKGELEDAVRSLGFEHVVILRPGLLVGERTESRPFEAALRGLAGVLGRVSGGVMKDFWAQDADVVARAAVRAGLECVEGRRERGVWVVGQGEIVRLGKVEGVA